MTFDGIPAEISQFIAEKISSVAHLEILLLLRNEQERIWTADDVSSALRTNRETAAEQLAKLRASGLVTSEAASAEQYRYAPRTAELRATVDKLAEIYELYRVTVITMIYSKPVDKVRTFADAFRLRQEK